MIVSWDKEQIRSSSTSSEVTVSLGLVLAWLFGALVLFLVLPSGPQSELRDAAGALRGVQLADQRVIGPRRNRLEHDQEPLVGVRPDRQGFVIASTRPIDAGGRGYNGSEPTEGYLPVIHVRESD